MILINVYMLKNFPVWIGDSLDYTNKQCPLLICFFTFLRIYSFFFRLWTGLVPGCAANNDAPFLYLNRCHWGSFHEVLRVAIPYKVGPYDRYKWSYNHYK